MAPTVMLRSHDATHHVGASVQAYERRLAYEGGRIRGEVSRSLALLAMFFAVVAFLVWVAAMTEA